MIKTIVHGQGPRSGFRQRGPLEKFATVFSTSYQQAEAPICTHSHLGWGMGTAQSASTLGDLRVTRKWQSYHKLGIGNWKTT